MDSNKFLTVSLPGFFLFFVVRDLLFTTDGSSTAANPQGRILGEGPFLLSCSKIQALSLAKSTNFCIWL
jgi:hypothetical protein